MTAIEEIEKKLLALRLEDRVFLAESLLASVPVSQEPMSEAQEVAEARRRDREIESGEVRALLDDEFWRGIETECA